jgi:carbamoyltransferase
MSVIAGINAYHGDAAVVLLRDGELVAAVEEERLRRVKHWAGFPGDALRACVEAAGIEPGEVTRCAVGRDPRVHLPRKALYALRRRPAAGFVGDRLRNTARIREVPRRVAERLGAKPTTFRGRVHWVEHHPAHLASAFFPSPFEEAAVCAIDGFGDFVSTSLAEGRGARLRVLRRVHFPHSLGLLYLALTQYLGFPRYGDEYKVMGLAAYGEPDYADALRRLVHLRPDGGFVLDLAYFRHHADGVTMSWDEGEPTVAPVYTPALEALLGPARDPAGPVEARHQAIAASLQAVFEETALHVLRELQRLTRSRNLCLAGGCALNSVLNGKIRERTRFREVYVQPAAGDSGTALGAALWAWCQDLGRPRRFRMDHAYWGPAFDGAAVRAAVAERAGDLARERCLVREIPDEEALCDWTAEQLAAGQVVGWFQGRMEWGPRALGNRSILADPRRADMRETINRRIKLREPFRPFAPSVLEEALDEYFVGAAPDPFMVRVHPVRPDRRAAIPAVTHVDGSGRLHTVSRRTNPLYWQLLRAFEKRSGVPVLLNTSFNESEPIVHRPAEALDCFLRTRMDALVLGTLALAKES